jgi:hypothetical protein
MVFRFGKYKGKNINNVPTDYLEYLLTWDDLWEHTRDRVVIELEKRYFGDKDSITLNREVILTVFRDL